MLHTSECWPVGMQTYMIASLYVCTVLCQFTNVIIKWVYVCDSVFFPMLFNSWAFLAVNFISFCSSFNAREPLLIVDTRFKAICFFFFAMCLSAVRFYLILCSTSFSSGALFFFVPIYHFWLHYGWKNIVWFLEDLEHLFFSFVLLGVSKCNSTQKLWWNQQRTCNLLRFSSLSRSLTPPVHAALIIKFIIKIHPSIWHGVGRCALLSVSWSIQCKVLWALQTPTEHIFLYSFYFPFVCIILVEISLIFPHYVFA